MRALASATLIWIAWLAPMGMPGVGRVALARAADHRLVRAPGAAQHHAGQHIGAERQQRQPEQRRRIDLRACMRLAVHRPGGERAALGHEKFAHRYVLRAGAGEADGMPRVDDLVFGAMDQREARIDRRAVVALAHHEAQHVPVGIVDARRHRPAARHLVAAVDLAAAPAGEGERRGDQACRAKHPRSRPASRARSNPASSDGWRGCRDSRRSRDRLSRSRRRRRPGCRRRDRRRRPARAARRERDRCGAGRVRSRPACAAASRTPARAGRRRAQANARARPSLRRRRRQRKRARWAKSPRLSCDPHSKSTHLILRSERSERLEGWATSVVRVPTLRDATLRAAPQGEVCTVQDRNQSRSPAFSSRG